ncbi:MAG: hypothetical protein ROR55_07615 [Devosia sp.]
MRRGPPSLAVLPFQRFGNDARFPAALALPHDLIAALSRLRWLKVIARASSFQFHGTACDPVDAAHRLGARYVLAGAVTLTSAGVELSTELTDAASGALVWADQYRRRPDDMHVLCERVTAEVLAALETRIPEEEAARAALTAPSNLDAWGAFHLGLRHMYRASRLDLAAAQALFAAAARDAPDFARPHAALSFVHFQNAFVHDPEDREGEEARARAEATRAMELDSLDPFSNYAYARAHWIGDDLEGAYEWFTSSNSAAPVPRWRCAARSSVSEMPVGPPRTKAMKLVWWSISRGMSMPSK